MSSTNTRADWNEYFMQVARLVATRSTCIAQKVGAVLVREKRIISTGYNGVPSGLEHCTDRGYCSISNHDCLSQSISSRAIHAEMNAIAVAAKLGVITQDAELYCTHHPCGNCLKLIIAAGVITVYCPVPERIPTIPQEYLNLVKIVYI